GGERHLREPDLDPRKMDGDGSSFANERLEHAYDVEADAHLLQANMAGSEELDVDRANGHARRSQPLEPRQFDLARRKPGEPRVDLARHEPPRNGQIEMEQDARDASEREDREEGGPTGQPS